jgi:hypothetical protein
VFPFSLHEGITLKKAARQRTGSRRHRPSPKPVEDAAGPQLVEAILQGRQPIALTATRLTELDLPLDWNEQRRLLAS